MTVAADSPPTILSLAAILAGTAAWTTVGTIADIYWPEEDDGTTGTYAVLEEGSESHRIAIFSTDLTVGALTSLAYALQFQLPRLYRVDRSGVHIGTEIKYDTFIEPSESQKAADGASLRVIILTLPIGVTVG